MQDKVLSPAAKHLLSWLAEEKIVKDFYLAGGTALALQYGHRKSHDFDWFSTQEFSLDRLQNKLKPAGDLMITAVDKGTWHGVVNKVRLTFLYYPYRLLWPLVDYHGVKIADRRDIACMKLQAVASRGSRKDFFDLYVLLRDYNLTQLLTWFDQKYSGIKYSRLHLLKSLVYFIDAEREPQPLLLERISWSEVKNSLQKQVRQFIGRK